MKSCLSKPSFGVAFFILLVLWGPSCVWDAGGGEGPAAGLTVLTWNVQNLFDDVDDGSEYSEFDPGQGWTRRQFLDRLERAAGVLRAAGLPDLAALQEVENLNTATVLRDRFLADAGYREVVVVPTAGSAVNTALLSKLPLERVSLWEPPPEPGETLRGILEVELVWQGRRLVVLNNHWKSRQPEAAATEPARRKQAAVVRRRVRELEARLDRPGILVVGDFNTDLAGNTVLGSVRPALVRSQGRGYEDQLVLGPPGEGRVADVWEALTAPGSYCLRGRWCRLDHIFFAGAIGTEEPWVLDQPRVWTAGLVGSDGQPRAWSPREPAGISDHLPLIVRLSVNPATASPAPGDVRPADRAGWARAE